MAKLIEVEERDLDYIFGKKKPYSLDVYQRDYRWNDEGDYKVVIQLLKDIELRFENNLRQRKGNSKSELKAIYGDVTKNFKPYFLNTIMLNEQEGNIYIADGQQRLTTLLLMLIKLYHLGSTQPKGTVLNVDKFLGEKIYEEDMAGEKDFKISNADRNAIIRKIFDQETVEDTDIGNISQKNLRNNYQIISKYYDRYMFRGDAFQPDTYNYYVYNLLLKVLIIEQVIKHKEDVAMIFETANDRGKELEPHEVLKGMLLGVLNVEEKEKCNDTWTEALNTFFERYDNYENVDDFFRTYFRAKYADNRSQYDNFAGKYHRNLLGNERVMQDLDRNDPEKIARFIRTNFSYFYKVYLEIDDLAKKNKNLYVAANHANERGQQYLLILSALAYQDAHKEEKISLVAELYDRFYTLCRLAGIYDSNDFQRTTYSLGHAIREKSLAEIEAGFDAEFVSYFNNQGIAIEKVNDIFQYKYFKGAKHDNRFTKYVLARIDRYLADLLHEGSFAKQESFWFLSHSGSKPKNGFHIEHMFSYNDEIMDQFVDENGEYDDELFHTERDRLGALLLLKGNENLRAGNWKYERKMKSYAQSEFIWNRILTGSVNAASIKSCDDEIKAHFKAYEPDENGLLAREAIDERQRLLFKLLTKIYQRP